MTDAQIQLEPRSLQLIQSRALTPGAGIAEQDISNHKLAHLKDLTERIYLALTAA